MSFGTIEKVRVALRGYERLDIPVVELVLSPETYFDLTEEYNAVARGGMYALPRFVLRTLLDSLFGLPITVDPDKSDGFIGLVTRL